MNRLDGRIALVTGGARGIGEAIARGFAREGARVVVTDIDDERGRAVADALGGGGTYTRLDVRIEPDWETVIGDVLQRFGRLDVVVNNAGITGFQDGIVPHDPEHATLDAWRAVLATNLDGVFLGCKHAIRAMRTSPPAGAGGSIINMSSRSGQVGIPGAAAYAASKAGVRNHSKTVALYCAGQGLRIRCNSVHPAAVLTPMWDAILGPPGTPEHETRVREAVHDVPAGRFGTAEEVAHLAVYLASDESAYTTGAEFVIDGGLLAGSGATPRPPN